MRYIAFVEVEHGMLVTVLQYYSITCCSCTYILVPIGWVYVTFLHVHNIMCIFNVDDSDSLVEDETDEFETSNPSTSTLVHNFLQSSECSI